MARLFSPFRLVALGFLLLVAAAALYFIPSDEYLFLPDRARAVAPFVSVRGERDDHDGGGIYYVAVEVKKASILEKLFHGLHEGSTLVPASALRAPGESEQQRRRSDQRQMAQSQEVAAAVALSALGRHVVAHSPGTLVAAVAPDGPAAGKLRAQDLVVTVDGSKAAFPADLRRLIRKHRPGDTVQLTIRRRRQLRTVALKTAPDPREPNLPVIGVFVDCALGSPSKIDLPTPVHIDLGQVGGPSAGLAFALDIVEELGHDVDHGHKIAATGELCLDGTVEPVGGVKQKTIGAKQAGADIFLVPAGENAATARRYAGHMRVIPVNSFRQALHVLATLQRKGEIT